jgi:tRNA (guanine-N7-)-methyltransferase
MTHGQQQAMEKLFPVYGIESGTTIDFSTLFGNDHPVILEIGFGNGDSLAKMAAARPEHNFLGIEVHRPGVGHLLYLVSDQGLENVRVICDDAVEILEKIPDGSLGGVQLFFPDPWHKKKHHKRRIVQADFVGLVARKLTSGGYLHMATDWQDYAEHMLEVMNAAKDFENCSADRTYVERPDYRPLTKFEQRGHRLGHGVWDLIFRKEDVTP